MSNSTDSTYFRELGLQEKKSKLAQIVRHSGKLVIWKKGDKHREHFQRLALEKDSLDLQLSGFKTRYGGQEVLYTFEFNGVHFFGKGKVTVANAFSCILNCDDTLYKRERRENFRLLTFPHHKVFIHIKMNNFEEESNIIDFNTQMSQTGLFKSFIKLIGEEDVPLREGYVCCRVVDISVTGLAIHVSELEKNYLQENSNLGTVFIDFKGEEIEIPKAEVVYAIDAITQDRTSKLFKLGIKFNDMNKSIDNKLGQYINDALREFTSDFEDFIK